MKYKSYTTEIFCSIYVFSALPSLFEEKILHFSGIALILGKKILLGFYQV